jgi:hypothetical protein
MLSMAINRTRKNKENPHYGFLVSWDPKQARVKRESKSDQRAISSEPEKPKKANISAKSHEARDIKKDIVRSLMVVGIVLTLEVVVYLAWNRIILP